MDSWANMSHQRKPGEHFKRCAQPAHAPVGVVNTNCVDRVRITNS